MAAVKKIGLGIDKTKLQLRSGFQSYYSKLSRSYSTYRALPTGKEDLSVITNAIDAEFGVHTRHGRRERYTSDQLIDSFCSGGLYAISGNGGSGKTIFLKQAVTKCIQRRVALPIFIVLRHGNFKTGSISNFIIDSLKKHIEYFDSSMLSALIKDNQCVLFLDGFDEVDEEERQKIFSEIQDLAETHNKLTIVLTTRPEFASMWVGFTLCEIMPLSKSAQVDFVRKLPVNYGDGLQDNLVEQIEAGLKDSYKSFFENPLLLSIVIITYYRDGKLCSISSDFYEQAFEALLFRHDRDSKGYFTRKRSSALNDDQLRKVFSAFCILTYIENEITFTRNNIIEYIKNACIRKNIDCDSNLILRDFVEALCLIVRDGDVYEFSHRSFQEYFSAEYAVNNDMKLDVFLEHILIHKPADSTPHLIYSLAPLQVYRSYISKINESTKISEKNTNSYTKRIIVGLFNGMQVDGILFHKKYSEPFDKLYQCLFDEPLIDPDFDLALDISDFLNLKPFEYLGDHVGVTKPTAIDMISRSNIFRYLSYREEFSPNDLGKPDLDSLARRNIHRIEDERICDGLDIGFDYIRFISRSKIPSEDPFLLSLEKKLEEKLLRLVRALGDLEKERESVVSIEAFL